MEEHLYYYRAEVISVYDGDTCTVDLDLGLGTWVRGEKIRLARINTPELRGEERPAGLVAADYLRNRIEGREVWIHTEKDKRGKFGRYLGDIWLKQDDGNFTNINDELVNEGYAEYKDY